MKGDVNMYQLNMDCEGPLTQNDNAYELCQEFIPEGGRFFSIVSKYDDFLADVVKKPGYKAGDTLRLVLPFLKAFGVTDEKMEEFSEKTLVLLPGTEVMLPLINGLLPSFIISTSYMPYLEALCKLTSFPMKNCYCTFVNLDEYFLPKEEAETLKALASEIAEMAMIKWPLDAKGHEDLEPLHHKTILRLDEIFWKIIPSMSIGRILNDVNPIGGQEKARAVEDSVKRTGLALNHVVYAGDSITDCQALDLVRNAGGIAISFNGNRYAIRSAEYAILSDNTCILYGISALLKEKGRDALSGLGCSERGVLDSKALVDAIRGLGISNEIFSEMEGALERGMLEVYYIPDTDFEWLVEKSEKIRKEVRGHKVGELG